MTTTREGFLTLRAAQLPAADITAVGAPSILSPLLPRSGLSGRGSPDRRVTVETRLQIVLESPLRENGSAAAMESGSRSFDVPRAASPVVAQ
jgi:hypothetical protein